MVTRAKEVVAKSDIERRVIELEQLVKGYYQRLQGDRRFVDQIQESVWKLDEKLDDRVRKLENKLSRDNTVTSDTKPRLRFGELMMLSDSKRWDAYKQYPGLQEALHLAFDSFMQR